MAQNGEFQIIERFFTHENFGAWESKGVGDDCAIIDMPAGRIAVTADMMAIEGVSSSPSPAAADTAVARPMKKIPRP